MTLVSTPAVLAALVLASGCHASVEADIHAGNKASAEVADFDKPLEQSSAEQQKAMAERPATETPLLGARQDLTYKGPARPVCKCLSVAVGQPGIRRSAGAGSDRRPTRTASSSSR